MPEVSAGRLHVAVAVVERHGRFLVTRRPSHVHQGGRWEFPGGKVEEGETTHQALARELREELGILLERARPLIRVPYDYPGCPVLLDVWCALAFSGEPRGLEGQALRWVAPSELVSLDLPAANRPVVAAALLPDRYLITPAPVEGEAFLARLEMLAARYPLIQLRAPALDETDYARLAGRALEICRASGARLLLNCAPELALSLGADGVHLAGRRLMRLDRRPLPRDRWVAASCHDAAQLAHAVAVGVDFAVLSPVAATASHPGTEPLGWKRFRALVEAVPLPVYALGGLGVDDLEAAWCHGAQGVAAIRGFWEAGNA